MNLRGWLRDLGLEQYETAFRENAIDETVLPRLTAQDLKDIGVVAVGHRRKLLDAIAALQGGEKTGAPDSAWTAERRQVAVMFSDLVGSTALSTRLDPEDLREIIASYQACVAETVREFGGYVAKYMGDGVLVYFGYPAAGEDDAERAVRAGLAVTAAVAALKAPVPLQTRVGIATGLVVVGDLVGSGAAAERGIVGETPNLAARLQGIAEPGTIVIDEATRKLLGNLFDLEDLGAHELKGMAKPVRASAVLAARPFESRFEALRSGGLTPLVAREREVSVLAERWREAQAGAGQLVLLSGEAGIGKSRVTAALLERLRPEPHACLRYFCSPQHTDSAFFPVIAQMERAAALARDDAVPVKLDKLDALVAKRGGPSADAALFAEMLSLPNDGRYPALDGPPRLRRRRLLEAFAAQIEAITASSPVLMIFEDAHWSDPTSLEALGALVDRMERLRLLLIVTFRPEFEPPWIGRSNATPLALGRLSQREIATMIDRLVGADGVAPHLRHEILARTDGVPLFVEEMTKAVLEAASEGRAHRAAASAPVPIPAVPAALHASLMSRLDRLGPAKEVAQAGAAIGREFSLALLALVLRKPEADTRAALDRLVGAGLLFCDRAAADETYQFNHALVRDIAYGSLLREPRRALHARIAAALETGFASFAENHPELVARHFAAADIADKAAALWGKAGRRSLARSALAEAADQLAHALRLIEGLPGTPALRRERIRLQTDLANALIHTKGHASPETRACFEQARALIAQAESLGELPDDPLAIFSVLYGFWVGSRMAFQGDVTCELAAQFMALAESQRETAPRMIGHLLRGISLVLVGDLDEGRTHLDRAVAFYDPAEHRPLATRFGHDVRVTALCWRGLASWMLGFPGAARDDARSALGDAREVGQAATSMFALSHVSLLLLHCGCHAEAEASIEELVALAEAKGSVYWQSYGTLLRGWLLALNGEASGAVSLATAASAAMRSTGATAYGPWYYSYLARAHAALGQFAEARRCLGDALRALETAKEAWCEADVLRIAGEIEMMSPRPDMAKAEASFEKALAVARRQRAKAYALRAATDLAKLWASQGKRQPARALLLSAYGAFTEGFDLPDLMSAKAVLDALAA